MRELKFRGKRKDNGKWVYGAYFNLHHNDERTHIHHFIIPNGSDISLGTPIERIQVEVEENTLGQYTGFKDKNGVEIYEGDIIKDAIELVYEIHWYADLAAIMAECTADDRPFFLCDTECGKSEIIGNIHTKKRDDLI